MKTNGELDGEYGVHFALLMRRLLRAGLITSYVEPLEPEDESQIQIQWNPDYLNGMGGEAVFFVLGALVTSICQESPLMEAEQELAEMMHQVLFEQRQAGGNPA